ncbi:MAG: AAA family ATPase [Patescibacteria group bacterium]
MTVIKRIGIVGAKYTGKSTLVKWLAEELKLPVISKVSSNVLDDYNISSMKGLPKELQAKLQKFFLFKQTTKEEENAHTGFIADKTAVDHMAATQHYTEMGSIDLNIYELLCQERMKRFTHIIYCRPLPATSERLDIANQKMLDNYIEGYLEDWVPGKYLELSETDVKERKELVKKFIGF